MTMLATLADNPFLIATGWILLVILWETSAVGALLALWHTARPGASARQEHTAAVVAFSLALILAAATPFALMSIPAAPAAIALPATSDAASRVPSAPSVPATHSTIVAGEQPGLATISGDAIAGVAAVIWILGVIALTARLLGGWILATTIRRRATPSADDRTHDLAGRLHAELGLRCPVALLRSGDVEAPVVIGWRRPAVILPTDLTERLASEMIAPILAHEFEHIRRRDYLSNMLQSIAELLLFFSPAVTWMSGRIRETREYCCDDAAVSACADAKHYVQALTTLASLGSINAARPVMGVAGPRLITRVRRLLASEARPGFRRLRLAAFALVLAALCATGIRVALASASRTSRVAQASAEVPREGPNPYGVATEQPGSGVEMHVVSSTWDAPVNRATVRNLTNETVSGVRFVALAERLPSLLSPMRMPIRLFTSDLLPVSIAPGATVEIAPEVLSASQLRQITAEFGNTHIQLFVGLTEVRYANGRTWQITPNRAAMNPGNMLGLPRPEVTREVIVRDAALTHVTSSGCQDQLDRTSSSGAVFPVRGEPGRFARCDNGRWVETTNRRRW